MNKKPLVCHSEERGISLVAPIITLNEEKALVCHSEERGIALVALIMSFQPRRHERYA